MPWWALVSFLIWIGYGVWQWKRGDAVLTKIQRIPHSRRTLFATLGLFGGAAFLVATLYVAWSFHLLSPQNMVVGFLVITGGGLVFVHLQTLAAALIMSLAVTPRTSSSSEDRGNTTQ